tara:strand:- start:943 stop:2076 length:1134 start_codon:yes stop_codon:yes gene_type:complete
MYPFILLGFAHVPTYSGCVQNCCTPPHSYDISQVIYLEGSGGLEIHTNSESFSRFTEILDVDVVFKDDIDQSTYDIYIGCGGCIPTDPIVIDPLVLNGYQSAEVEPFTQTQYRSLFAKADRKYNTSLLRSCEEDHFTVRLVDYDNRTDESSIIWGPVIGLKESFTLIELLEFPIYILRNHGSYWNGLWWTYWTWLILTPIIMFVVRFLLQKVGYSVFTPWKKNVFLREILYEIAIIGFASAALEKLTHLIIVQIGVQVNYAFYVGLFAVILFSQGVPILFTYITWYSLLRRDKNLCISSAYWGPVEVLTGFSFLFLFGAGFYIGPAAIILAGILRCFEICRYSPKEKEEQDVPQITVGKTCMKSDRFESKSKSLGFV